MTSVRNLCQPEWSTVRNSVKGNLRHQDLKTTQIYLGKVSEHEAIRWIDILHGIKEAPIKDYGV